jgi:hypothetical protein
MNFTCTDLVALGIPCNNITMEITPYNGKIMAVWQYNNATKSANNDLVGVENIHGGLPYCLRDQFPNFDNNAAITVDEDALCDHLEETWDVWREKKERTFQMEDLTCLEFSEYFWPGFVSDRYIQYVTNHTPSWDNAAKIITAKILNKTWYSNKNPPNVLFGTNWTGINTEVYWDDEWIIENNDGSGDGGNLSVTSYDLIAESARLKFEKLGTAYSESPWIVPATMVNAIYDPLANTVFIPLGIMQPPLYHPQYDDALNYGGLGYIIGHEIGHAHDYMGTHFDSNGRWLENADESEVQFHEWYQNTTSRYLNSTAKIPTAMAKHTLNEDIADYYGMQSIISIAPKGKTLYYQFAQTWCGHRNKQNFTEDDTHAPGMWRVNISLRDAPSFIDTFGCI